MANTGQTHGKISGYFPDEELAESALRELHSAGFTHDQISLAGTPEGGGNSAAIPPASADAEPGSGEGLAHREGRKAGEAVGGFWQRIRALFEGESVGPNASAGSAGGVREDLLLNDQSGTYDYDAEDFHQSWGGEEITENRSRYFSNRWGHAGEGVLLSVIAGDRRAEAEAILEANGADLGDTRNDNLCYHEGTGGDSRAPVNTVTTGDSLGVGTPLGSTEEADIANSQTVSRSAGLARPQRIQLYGEVLRVHRQRIERGEVQPLKRPVDTNGQQVVQLGQRGESTLGKQDRMPEAS